MYSTSFDEIFDKMIGNKKERRRAEDLDAGNGKVHTIAEMEKMLEAIK